MNSKISIATVDTYIKQLIQFSSLAFEWFKIFNLGWVWLDSFDSYKTIWAYKSSVLTKSHSVVARHSGHSVGSSQSFNGKKSPHILPIFKGEASDQPSNNFKTQKTSKWLPTNQINKAYS
jgi:hypothetical protein